MGHSALPVFHFRVGMAVCLLLVATLCLSSLDGCSINVLQRELVEPTQTYKLDPDQSPYLKAHMRNGQVYVLSNWSVLVSTRAVRGSGKLLNLNREVVSEGFFTLSLDSVAIFETNTTRTSPSVVGMAVLTGMSLAVTAFCILNPKACFGSCPTFYASDGTRELLQAEGFSASVAPCLEATDIDPLFRAKPAGREFRLTMKNEALETHVVRTADLLVAPRPAGGRVLLSGDGRFWQVDRITPPSAATAAEGNCLEQLRAFDGIERCSLTDSHYLGTREIIDLQFDRPIDSSLGLVIAFRQSLLTTYLFYQTLSYMGRTVADWFALLETGGAKAQLDGLRELLGGIEVLVPDNHGGWQRSGQLRETGPLATNIMLLPLGSPPAGCRSLRLRLTQGHWRLDYVALAHLIRPVEPVRLQPEAVYRDSIEDEDALRMLKDSTQVLVTLPGDEYTLIYRLPENQAAYELFLSSRGYYLEWIREEWLAEEDLPRAAMLLFNPQAALTELAPAYKRIESQMEELFWRSRYVR